MTAQPRGELQVGADLQLELGGVRATIVGDGTQLTFSTADVGRLVAELTDTAAPAVRVSTLRAEAGKFADRLSAAGLTLRVVEDGGTVAELGRGCGSRLGGLLSGSDHVTVRRLPTAAVVAVVRRTTRRHRGLALIGGVVAVVVVSGAAARGGRR